MIRALFYEEQNPAYSLLFFKIIGLLEQLLIRYSEWASKDDDEFTNHERTTPTSLGQMGR